PRVSSLAAVHATHAPDVHTLSLHDALPILQRDAERLANAAAVAVCGDEVFRAHGALGAALEIAYAHRDAVGVLLERRHFHSIARSEEHTSELQSRENLVCRPLLEKKKPHAL